MARAFALVSVVVALLGLPSIALADETKPELAKPWDGATALLKDLDSAVGAGGVLAVEAHAAEIESDLANAKLTWDDGNGTVYVLTDGAGEALVAMTIVTQGSGAKHAVALDNPYPPLAMYLGSYYNEVGKPDQALRVLDVGLSLSAVSGVELGEHRPLLLSERGASLLALHRWDEALADYEEGLKTSDLDNANHARLLRGKGYALTELKRLDEAEAAYNKSLEFDPDSPLAKNELEYIARLKAGQPPAPPGNLKPLQPTPAAPETPPSASTG